MRAIEAENLANRVQVYSRVRTLLFDTLGSPATSAASALEAERNRPWTSDEKQTFEQDKNDLSGYNCRMPSDAAGIVILKSRIERAELARLVEAYFEDMVKYVVDVARGVIAVGGELHADAEQRLLEAESHQPDLWGANYYPGRGRDGCIEFTALINIRPAQGNRSMEVQDPAIREKIRVLTFALIGEGEAL